VRQTHDSNKTRPPVTYQCLLELLAPHQKYARLWRRVLFSVCNALSCQPYNHVIKTHKHLAGSCCPPSCPQGRPQARQQQELRIRPRASASCSRCSRCSPSCPPGRPQVRQQQRLLKQTRASGLRAVPRSCSGVSAPNSCGSDPSI
jgi:hypothetical protein